MTATLHADLVKKAREAADFYSGRPSINEQRYTPTTTEVSRRECLEIAVRERELAEAIESLERQLAAIREEQRRCGICGGLVDLRNAEKPSVSIGVGNHVKQRARHRERMKEGKS